MGKGDWSVGLIADERASTEQRDAITAIASGSAGGPMAALSGLLGWPLARLGTHHGIARGISLAVGAMSMTLGLFWGYPLLGRVF